MLGALATQIDAMAAALAQERAQVSPLASHVLSVLSGSTQRLDVQLVDELHIVMRSLAGAQGALAQAAAVTRRAEQVEFEAEMRRREAAARAGR